jgi:hypothetical protein
MSRASELNRLFMWSLDYRDGNKDRNHINGMEHALRVATLAKRHAPNDEELIFAALVHDLARPLSDPFHGEVIAEICRDLVREELYWVLRTHGEYQADYIHETDFVDETTPWHRTAVALCAWEIASFERNWDDRFPRLMEPFEAYVLINRVCGNRP